jgi:hypothetical protein
MTNRAFGRRWKSPAAVVAISVIAIGASLWGWRNLDTSSGRSAVPVAPATSQRRAADTIERMAAKQAAPIPEAPAIGDKTSSVAKVDSKRVDELAAALNSGGADEQIEAINLFAKVGTAEQKAAIVAKARNRDANVAVRLAAVENIDWREHMDLITDIIRSEPELGEAALCIAAHKELPSEVVAAVAETAAPLFQASADPGFQLAVLNFFIEHHLDGFPMLIAKANTNGYSDTEIEDLNQLIATWNGEKGVLQDTPNPK